MFFCNYFMLSHRQTSLQIIFTSINSVVFLYQHSARSRSCRRHEYNFVYFVSFVGKLKFLKFKLTFRVFEKGNAFEFYPQALCYLPLRAFSFKINNEGLPLASTLTFRGIDFFDFITKFEIYFNLLLLHDIGS